MTATDRAVELIVTAARAASDKLASQIVAFDVSDQLAITDAFLIASASNDRQVKAIVDEVEDKLREAGAKPLRREGERDGRWVLIDYGDVVIHIQHEEERQFYALERLWRDCPSIALPADVVSHQGDPTRLVLLRHGQTEWNSLGRAQGHADISLDAIGHAQAAAAAPYLAAMRPVRLWSSDLARARETAAYVAGAASLEVELDPRLREYDVGVRSGLTTAEFEERHPREYAAWLAHDESLLVEGEESSTLGPRARAARPDRLPRGAARRRDGDRGHARRLPAGRAARGARLAAGDLARPARHGQLRLDRPRRPRDLRRPPDGLLQRDRERRPAPRPRRRGRFRQ